MRAFLCNLSLPHPLPLPSSHSSKSSILTISTPSSSSSSSYWVKVNNEKNKLMSSILSGALSFTLLLSSPSLSFALDSTLSPSKPVPFDNTPALEGCREDDTQQQEEENGSQKPQLVSNETIVEEAWQIVNDSFLATGSRPWSPQSWQQKKDDVMSSKIQSRAKAHDLIKRMLAGLGDHYTRFLSPDEFSKMARYDMTGIGINIREFPDSDGNVRLKVLGLLLDGPAQAAGMRQGDEILAVNGEDVRGKSAFEVSSLLQGPNGTSVTIKVKHGDCGPIQFMEVQRQLIARTPVFYRLEKAENGSMSIGYMRLKEFNALAQKDLVSVKRLENMGASYFILDLRDNLGGLVQAGIEIAKLFLDPGETVIYTVGRDAQYQNTIVSDAKPLVSAPVIVLVNNKTASASEIVASALHDNCRAVLVGQRTYGKGLIQSVFELDDGSGIVITVGKYVTPNHKDINGNGIEPDYRNLPAWSEVTKHLSQCTKPQQG